MYYLPFKQNEKGENQWCGKREKERDMRRERLIYVIAEEYAYLKEKKNKNHFANSLP